MTAKHRRSFLEITLLGNQAKFGLRYITSTYRVLHMNLENCIPYETTKFLENKRSYSIYSLITYQGYYVAKLILACHALGFNICLNIPSEAGAEF